MLSIVARFVLLSVAMALAGSGILSPRLADSQVSVFYLPQALLLATLFLAPGRREAAAAVAAFLAAGLGRAFFLGGQPLVVAPFLALDIADVLMVAWVLRRLGVRGTLFRTTRDVAAFIALSVAAPFVVSLVAALLEATPQTGTAFGPVDASRFVRDWTFGSACAYLGAGAAMLTLGRLGWRRCATLVASRPVEFVAAMTFLSAAVAYDFEVAPATAAWLLGAPVSAGAPHPSLLFLTFPAVIWLSFRFRQLGAGLGVLFTTVPAIQLVAAGYGPIWLDSAPDRTIVMQAYVGVVSLAALNVAALGHALTRRDRMLRRALALANRRAADRAAFLGAINHEMRTPLNGILGFTALMRSEVAGPLSPRYREFVVGLDQSGKRLLEMVTEFLDLSRMQSGLFRIDFAEVRPAEVADEVFLMMAGVAERNGVRLLNDCPPDRALRSSALALRHAVMNLVSNGLRHTPQGGEVRVACFSTATHDVVEVADTGPGFDPETLKGPSRMARSEQRAGLGLQIVDAIMALHDGRMTISGEEGKGARIRLFFPQVGA